MKRSQERTGEKMKRVKFNTVFKNKPVYFEIVSEKEMIYHKNLFWCGFPFQEEIEDNITPCRCVVGWFLVPESSITAFIKNLFSKSKETRMEYIGRASAYHFPEIDALFIDSLSFDYWKVKKADRLLAKELFPQIEQFFTALYNPARIIVCNIGDKHPDEPPFIGYERVHNHYIVKKVREPHIDEDLRRWIELMKKNYREWLKKNCSCWKKVATAGTQEREGESNSPPYGIPIREVGEELLHLTPDHFKDKVVGQDRAIEEFVRGIKLGAQQLLRGNKKRERVIASAIFVGLTGVGKTETAKTLAELLEPLGYQFVRIDLNMYSDSHSAWSLIGSPRGYVGSDQGGVLTQALKKNPRAVILFDEMEKAHPNLHTTFMTMLDEGYIEDQSFGEKIYLDGAIIIFTSNLFAREINNLTKLERDPTSLELRIRDYVERYFGRPEIVGRIDKIVPFRELKKEDLAEIARRVLARYGEEGRAQELTEKFYSVANRYGVRMFVKKVEEAVLLGDEPPVRDEEGRKPVPL